MINQLLLSKYLFLKGEKALNEKTPFSCGHGISLFQDSIEIMIRCIAVKYDADVNERTPFDKLFDKIKEAKKNTDRKDLPLKSIVAKLNKTRVLFKHYGTCPEISEGPTYQVYTEEFLRECTITFFDVDFDTLSLAELIQDENIKYHIIEAEKLYANFQYRESLGECGKAEVFLSKKIFELFPSITKEIEKKFVAGQLASGNIEGVIGGYKSFHQIVLYLNMIRECTIVSILGENLSDYLLFLKLVPGVSILESGEFEINYKTDDIKKTETDYCLEYITKLVLRAEEKLFLKSNKL